MFRSHQNGRVREISLCSTDLEKYKTERQNRIEATDDASQKLSKVVRNRKHFLETKKLLYNCKIISNLI